MKDKEIKRIAKKLATLEQKGTAEAHKTMEEIASTLTLEEMLSIDDYIMQQKLLGNKEI